MNPSRQRLATWIERARQASSAGRRGPPADGEIGLDSLGLVNLILLIESEFRVVLDEEDLQLVNFESVDACLAMIERSSSKSNGGAT